MKGNSFFLSLVRDRNPSIIPLKNNGAIRLTVAKYYLPSGKSISEIGVSPDIEVNEESDNFRIKSETDNQLNYAIKLLKG